MVKFKKYVETVEDLLIKHHQCYIATKYPLGTSKENVKVFRVIDFLQGAGGLQVILSGIDASQHEHRWANIRKNLILDYPELGAINLYQSVVYTRRKLKVDSPGRYKKSLRIESLSHFNPNRIEQEILNVKPIHEGSVEGFFTLAKYIYLNKKYTSKEALESILRSERVGTAFSKEYYYTLNACNNTISLWRGCNIIGAFNKDTYLFELSTSLFNDDLSKLEVPFKNIEGGGHA